MVRLDCPVIAFLLILAAHGAATQNPAMAGDDASPAEDAERSRREFQVNKQWRMQLGPAGDLYPRYIADPRRPKFTIASGSFSDSDIPDAGDARLILRLGGRYGFMRFYKEGNPDRGFQIDAEGGFFGQFDRDNSTDNIGWDGLYGLQVAWASGGRLALRFGVFHDSSHVGDEYAERTGRTRLEYTREEYRGGVSWQFARKWRVYAEAGYGFDLRNEELMEPWRVQYGLECDSPFSLWNGRAGWYVATDVAAYEEDADDANITVQGGLTYRLDDLGRVYRIGLEFYDGRSLIGEFFQNTEKYVAFGFWFDL